MTLEQKIAQLQGGKPNAISFEFNEHWADREPVAKAVDALSQDNWISDEDRQKCIETNSLWVVRWYRLTTLGQICVCGSSLNFILDYLLEAFEL